MKIEGFSQLKKIFHLSDNAKEEEVFTGSIYCVSKITYNFFVFDKFKVQRHTLFNNTIMHQEEFRYLTRLSFYAIEKIRILLGIPVHVRISNGFYY